MCRMLCVLSDEPMDMAAHLARFAELSKDSEEYQGHGWGCAYLQDSEWQIHKNIRPVWEDDLTQFPRTTLCIAHARSAFRDEGIVIENNMPFSDDDMVFVFNGELQGVRIREDGRIGAEKIFNFVKRFGTSDVEESLSRAMKVLEKRSKYIRAANCIIAGPDGIFLATRFNENPGYFQMHEKHEDCHMLCSEPFPGEKDWTPLPNGTIKRWPA